MVDGGNERESRPLKTMIALFQKFEIRLSGERALTES
jgi:hypothetical protein